MITIDFIKRNSKPHPLEGGRQTVLSNDKYMLSIVGGRTGLYGDFEEDFEFAIMDVKDRNFVTKLFVDVTDDIFPYATVEEVEKIANTLFKENDFQVS
jgi:hypothetical protein